tara:strand:+ start:221 stop:445 length:225 start_codon:yes stop_codon:yes gene_type:complete
MKELTKTIDMNKEKLMDELNDLIECILCPSDLIESIDEYVRLKKIEELKLIEKNIHGKNINIVSSRIKALKKYI